jgi:hypothetical protein
VAIEGLAGRFRGPGEGAPEVNEDVRDVLFESTDEPDYSCSFFVQNELREDVDNWNFIT